MDQKKYIFGNWKMAQDKVAALQFLKSWSFDAVDKVEAAIFPSFVHLESCFLNKPKSLSLGAQDCSDELKGAFTGEVSSFMLKELGLKYCLVGHSERRQRAHETNSSLQKKLLNLEEVGICPVFCVGESRADRESGKVESVLENQLAILDESQQVICAYEPVWAIGTGLTATTKEIEETHAFIKSKIGNRALLYGGSVKSANAAEILACQGVDGLLIGGASLDLESFSEICRFALETPQA